MTAGTRSVAPRGSPLVMLVLLLTAWSGARALWWENPFTAVADVLAPVWRAASAGPPGTDRQADMPGTRASSGRGNLALPAMATGFGDGDPVPARLIAPTPPRLAAAHNLLWYSALGKSSSFDPGAPGNAGAFASRAPGRAGNAPFLPPPAPARGGTRRWSLDAWAFWRQGSDAAPISQGRVPIYGASQAGAVLQYRVAPDMRQDPRLFVRGYRSLVRRGESEVSLGASARLLARVPVRVAAEVRYTDAAFRNEVRPSAFAVTELPPVALPFDAQLEAYGQAGWVGGASATAFADGQASVTRGIDGVGRATDNTLRLSVGAAAWGGAQRDAQRIDLGPTMRLDLTVGDVPARLSVDWRERVGGQAGPESGLAATLSTRF